MVEGHVGVDGGHAARLRGGGGVGQGWVQDVWRFRVRLGLRLRVWCEHHWCLPRYGPDARGVRHAMRTSPSACSPRTSRLPDCCVARALHHLVLHTLVRVLISLTACSHFALLSLLLSLFFFRLSTERVQRTFSLLTLHPRFVSVSSARPLRCRCSSPAPLRSSTR